MNNAPTKTEVAKPTGRRYANVSDLLLNEKVSAEVRAEVATLNAQTVVIRQLITLRASAGLTQTDLAQKIGCTQSRISKLEASKDEDITLGVIREYVQATGARFSLSCGKPVNHVEAVKNHALSIRHHLEALAEIAQKHDELEPHIQGFFGEAFFNILNILSECQGRMPKAREDFEFLVTTDGNNPAANQAEHDEKVCAV